MAKRNCRLCGSELEGVFFHHEHCHECIIKRLNQGARFKEITNTLIPGTHWDLVRNSGRISINASNAIVTIRKLVNDLPKEEIEGLAEFSSMQEAEFEAVFRKALELGPKQISTNEQNAIQLSKIHTVTSLSQAKVLSENYPLLLINMHMLYIADGLVASIGRLAKANKFCVGDIMRTGIAKSDILKYLKGKGIWLQGCWIMSKGNIILYKKYPYGFFRSSTTRESDFIKTFINDELLNKI